MKDYITEIVICALITLALGGVLLAVKNRPVEPVEPAVSHETEEDDGAALRVLMPSQGGTGTGVTPSNGYVLVASTSGLYEPRATSTLGFTSGGTQLSTSSNPTIGNLAYWTGASTLGDVATRTLTATGALSLSQPIFGIGSANSVLTCTSSSGSADGCLSSANFTIFNNKVSSTSIDTSSEFFALLTNETGSGSVVGSISPAFTGLPTFTALSVSGSSTLGYASSTSETVSGNSWLTYASSTGLTSTNAVLTNLTNTNATSSGVLTVSGVLKIPSGTSPICDDPGEICHDTSDNQLVFDDWVIPSKTELYQRTIASTSVYFATSSSWRLPSKEDGYVVTDINCSVNGGTSKVLTIFGETLTCDADGAVDDGTISIATIGAGSTTPTYTLGNTVGVVNEIIFTVTGYKTRE